jgi:hypothetical protein
MTGTASRRGRDTCRESCISPGRVRKRGSQEGCVSAGVGRGMAGNAISSRHDVARVFCLCAFRYIRPGMATRAGSSRWIPECIGMEFHVQERWGCCTKVSYSVGVTCVAGITRRLGNVNCCIDRQYVAVLPLVTSTARSRCNSRVGIRRPQESCAKPTI